MSAQRTRLHEVMDRVLDLVDDVAQIEGVKVALSGVSVHIQIDTAELEIEGEEAEADAEREGRLT